VSVKDVDQMDEVLKALEGAANGLDILDKYDFIHRDVSVSNILLVDGIGKISDFEFVQKTRQGAVSSDDVEADGHPGRTGTRHFMASELRYGRYMYVPRRFDVFRWTFKQSTMHDAEALWWALIWILAWNRPGVKGLEDVDEDEDDSKRYSLISDLFPSADQPTTLNKRQFFFDNPVAFKHRATSFHPRYEKLLAIADDLRDGLLDYYEKEGAWTSESGPDETVFKGVYGNVALPKLKTALKQNDVGKLRVIKVEAK